MNQWIYNQSNEDYRAQTEFVSSSNLKQILRSEHSFDFGLKNPKKQTKAMRFGTLAHHAILEGSDFLAKYIVMPEFESFDAKGNKSESKNTTYYKKQVSDWKESLLPDAVVVTQQEFDDMRYMIDAVLANDDAVRLLKNGSTEVSGYYTDPETGIKCKIRPDFLANDLNALVDVKTVAVCNADWFRRNRVEDFDHMYLFQNAMYEAGIELITGKKPDFSAWILVENNAPFECIVIPVEEVYREIGGNMYSDALNKLKTAREAGTFKRQHNMQEMHPSHNFLQRHGRDF